MASLWATGPAFIYAAPPTYSIGSALFVGTCEQKPTFDVDFLFAPLMNDVAGDESMDEMYVGQRGTGSFSFGRFNYNVAEALANANPAAALAVAAGGGVSARGGLSVPGDIGSLMLTEGRNFVLYVVFPYYVKPAMGAGAPAGMVPGYRFPGCMVSKHSPKMGTQPHSKTMIVNMKRIFDPTVTNAYGYGGFLLYDYSIAGLPAPN